MEEPGAIIEIEEIFFNFFTVGGTMTERNFQEGEIFVASKMDKFYVGLTPLSDTNLMGYSCFHHACLH